MRLYLITYDLNAEGKDYTGLYQKIKEIAPQAWVHPMESIWCIKVPDTDFPQANFIFDKLKPFIDSNDNLFVVEITGKDRQGWMSKSFWSWLKN